MKYSSHFVEVSHEESMDINGGAVGPIYSVIGTIFVLYAFLYNI